MICRSFWCSWLSKRPTCGFLGVQIPTPKDPTGQTKYCKFHRKNAWQLTSVNTQVLGDKLKPVIPCHSKLTNSHCSMLIQNMLGVQLPVSSDLSRKSR